MSTCVSDTSSTWPVEPSVRSGSTPRTWGLCRISCEPYSKIPSAKMHRRKVWIDTCQGYGILLSICCTASRRSRRACGPANHEKMANRTRGGNPVQGVLGAAMLAHHRCRTKHYRSLPRNALRPPAGWEAVARWKISPLFPVIEPEGASPKETPRGGMHRGH